MIFHTKVRRSYETDVMNREDLINTLLGFNDGGHLHFVREWLEQQPAARLRLLVIAARLYGELKMRRGYGRLGEETTEERGVGG